MTGVEFVELYQRDLGKLITELELFREEENLWKTAGAITNASGNLALHIIGGLNFHIGNTLGNTGYIRNRDLEFTDKNIPREVLIKELRSLVSLIHSTLSTLRNDQLNEPFPRFFDKENASTSYVLVQLLLHLNYHTGQVNYLRRAIEGSAT